MKKLCLFILLITGLSVASFAATTDSKAITKEVKELNKKAVTKEIVPINKKSLDQRTALKRLYVMWAPCGLAIIETGTDKELSPRGYLAIWAAMWLLCSE